MKQIKLLIVFFIFQSLFFIKQSIAQYETGFPIEAASLSLSHRDSALLHTHSLTSHLFLGFAYSFAPDFEQSPYSVNANYETYYNYSTSPTSTSIIRQGNEGMRQLTTNFESVGIKGRFNIAEYSSITSLSISFNPTLGLGLSFLQTTPPDVSGGITGYGSINVPLFLEFNYGGGATRLTHEEYGMFACAGAEFTMAPLIQIRTLGQTTMNENGTQYYMGLTNKWVEPVVGLGIRYYDKKNRLREVYLKYGVGATNLFMGPTDYYPVSGHPWTLKLTFVREL